MPPHIEILPAHQIDSERWNSCIADASNGMIYSTYEYLSSMCDNWHGAVVNDYNAVMALPWRRKFGIRYTYEPAFIQQLGLVGSIANVNADDVVLLFAKYGDALFNFGNQAPRFATIEKRTNLILDLSLSYDRLSAAYKKDLAKNLKRANKQHLVNVHDLSVEEAISQYRQHYNDRFTNISAGDYERFGTLARKLAAKDQCFTKKICNKKGELLAIGLFLKDEKRIYNLMNTTTALGRATEANPLLIDFIIRQFSGTELLLDFEGSDLPGVKSFYEKFGAINQPFYHWHFNRFSFPFNLFR